MTNREKANYKKKREMHVSELVSLLAPTEPADEVRRELDGFYVAIVSAINKQVTDSEDFAIIEVISSLRESYQEFISNIVPQVFDGFCIDPHDPETVHEKQLQIKKNMERFQELAKIGEYFLLLYLCEWEDDISGNDLSSSEESE